jgi:hypothetical protein
MAPPGWAEGELVRSWRRDYAQRGVVLSRAGRPIAAAVRVGARPVTGNPAQLPLSELEAEHRRVGE